jgi:CRISPR-associated endonuclease/helicase Cas3
MRQFDDFFRTAVTGTSDAARPYPYQRRLAEQGLPELLDVPTGMGKTLGVTLAWLYRATTHPDLEVRSVTPKRLVYVLPMRVLVEQTRDVIQAAVNNLGFNEIRVRTLMGGEPMTGDNDWRLDSPRPSVVVGTLDMILSRCLNRGFGESRYLWPIDFGLLNTDSQFVFDEVQLMGPALATSRQLHGLRQSLGTATPCRSTWMSATVDRSRLLTVDAPTIHSTMSLDSADLQDSSVGTRLNASKRVDELTLTGGDPPMISVASSISELHRPGTTTLVILNTVERATELHAALLKRDCAAKVVLLHSRFRPGDRADRVTEALQVVDADGPGSIIVSTQVIEAGVDLSASTLVTEAAPWSAIVQRAGRCNRDGLATEARMLWIRPTTSVHLPYEPSDVEAAVKRLEELSGTTVTSRALLSSPVEEKSPILPVLRRRDLLELFDTLPDVTGNDIDVSRFLRDANDLDVAVAWRVLAGDLNDDLTMPGREERCPVPIRQFRDWHKRNVEAVRRWNHLDRRWIRCTPTELRPGMLVLVDAAVGGYRTETGWTPSSKGPVAEIETPDAAASDVATGDDPLSVGADWVTLRQHLADTRVELEQFLDLVQLPGLSEDILAAAVKAAALHDVGKAHPVFQASLSSVAQRHDQVLAADEVFAKSGCPGRLRHTRPNFRHELASALCLLGEGAVALEGVTEQDLAIYLVAAHHGRVRVGARTLTGDAGSAGFVMGIEQGEQLPAVVVDDGEIPASVLDTSVLSLGAMDGSTTWTQRALALLGRDDLGPFRLGYLEAVVRLADWRASRMRSSAEVEAL